MAALATHEAQVRYSNLVDLRLRASLVTLDSGSVPVFNTRYEGSPTAGAVKIPVRDAEVEVNDYDHQNGAGLTVGSTNYISVTDFKDQVVNELIDGYEAAAVPDNLVADRLDSAGYAGSKILDADGILTLAQAATLAGSKVALTKDTVFDEFVDAGTYLSDNNVPMQGRWAIVRPSVLAALIKSPDFIKQSEIGQNLVQQGYVGLCNGFAIKVSNVLPYGAEFIVGHADWCHRIREWMVLPHVQDLSGSGKFIGASAVQGRWVYKHVVSKAKTVYMKCTILILALVSAAGATIGTTKVTVSPAVTAGNTYAYKVGTAADVPASGADLTAWAAWDGTEDITAATGSLLIIAEIDGTKKAVKAGTVIVKAAK